VNIGDRVVRKSYNKDIVFKIIDIEIDDEGVIVTAELKAVEL